MAYVLIPVLTVFIISVAYIQFFTPKAKMAVLTDFDKSILGTRLDPSLLKAQHIHADFSVFINDVQLNFNDEKYFERSVFIHVEPDSDGSGGKKFHMHSTNIPLWVFFESGKMNFTEECVTSDDGSRFCGDVKFYVNGVQNSQYQNYVFKNSDKILISFNSTDINREINSVTNFSEKD